MILCLRKAGPVSRSVDGRGGKSQRKKKGGGGGGEGGERDLERRTRKKEKNSSKICKKQRTRGIMWTGWEKIKIQKFQAMPFDSNREVEK